jgi:hypothetical protein
MADGTRSGQQQDINVRNGRNANGEPLPAASPREETPNRVNGTITASTGVSANTEDVGIGALSSAVIRAGVPYCTLRFGKYDRPKPFSSSNLVYDLHLALPLPNELQDQTGVDYSEKSLGTVGDVINGNINTSALAAAGLRHAGDMAQGALGGAASALGALGGRMGVFGVAAGNFITNAAATLAPAEQITSAIQQSTGAAPNPNPSLMFEGPQLREFTYSWTFMPDNKTESENLRKFIKNVKARVLPRVTQGLSPVLFYPHMVQMNFYPWDEDGSGSNPWGWGENTIIKMKKCVVKSFNINYTPVNVPAFFDGNPDAPHPVAITCTINLKELEYMLSNDWGGGFAGDLVVNVDPSLNIETAAEPT